MTPIIKRPVIHHWMALLITLLPSNSLRKQLNQLDFVQVSFSDCLLTTIYDEYGITYGLYGLRTSQYRRTINTYDTKSNIRRI